MASSPSRDGGPQEAPPGQPLQGNQTSMLRGWASSSRGISAASFSQQCPVGITKGRMQGGWAQANITTSALPCHFCVLSEFSLMQTYMDTIFNFISWGVSWPAGSFVPQGVTSRCEEYKVLVRGPFIHLCPWAGVFLRSLKLELSGTQVSSRARSTLPIHFKARSSSALAEPP